MQGYKQNQKPYPQQKDNNRFGQKQCQLGWNCDKILLNKCKFKHDQNDKEDIEALNRIKKNKIIIITDTYYKEIRPICLFEVFLPIKVIPNEKLKIQVGKYYVGYFISVEKRCAIIELEVCLGKFGQWKIERRIFQDHLSPKFEKCLPKENYKEKRGKISVNGALQKVLSGEQGLREYFQKVNGKGKYPLFEGCEVFYFEKNKTIQISRIKYPEYQKFSGILQIDGSSQFYFIARSETYDEMNPYRIPEELTLQLKEFIHNIPYTMLKKEALKKQVKDKINNMLKDYLVKGQFEQWPLQSRYPIIAIQNEVQKRTFQSEKQGIIYETGISIKSFSKNEKKQSDKILNKLKIKDFEKKRKLFKGNIFTVDNKNTKCHDDALEIEQTADGEFKVKIHIADIAEVIKSSSSLDKNMRERDSTLYIRDYFQPMIHQSLRNKLSLKSGDPKLALSLAFKVSKNGQVDFSTVRFIKSIIQVQQNLAHERLQKGNQKYPELFTLSECLGKGDLLKESSLIEYGSKSEFCMSRMIDLSAIIPTVMLQLNIDRTKEFKKKFDEYLKKIIEEKQKQMQKWENQVQKINKVRKQLRMVEIKERKIKNQISKEINKQKQKLLKKIKQENKAKTQLQKKEKKEKIKVLRDRNFDENISQQETEQQSQIEVLNEEETQDIGVTEQNQAQIIEKLNELMRKEKEMRTNALKQMKNKENFIEMSSSQSQFSQDDSEQGIQLNAGYKMTKAMGGKKFLQKIFSYFNIQLEWLSLHQINKAFTTILSLDKGKLYQEYFKRIQITNRQHFPYIIDAARKQKRQGDRKLGKQTDKRPERRDKTRRIEQNQNVNQRVQKKQTVIQLPSSKENHNQKPKNRQKTEKRYQRKNHNKEEKQIQQLNQPTNIKIEENNQESHQQIKESKTVLMAQLQEIKNETTKISKNLSNLKQKSKIPLFMPSRMIPPFEKDQFNMNPYLKGPPIKPGMSSPSFTDSFLFGQKTDQQKSNPSMMPSFNTRPPIIAFPTQTGLGLQEDMSIKTSTEFQINRIMQFNKKNQNFKIMPLQWDKQQKVKEETEDLNQKFDKNLSYKKVSSKQIYDSNEWFEKEFQKIQFILNKKEKPILSQQVKQKFKEMIKKFENNLQEVQEKYFDIISKGKTIKVEFSQEQKQVLDKNSQEFRINYEILKKKKIIKLYQQIKQQKWIDKHEINKNNSKNDRKKERQLLQSKEQRTKIDSQIQNNNKNQKIKQQEIEVKQIKTQFTTNNKKNQTNVQASVEVNALTKAQTVVQQKTSTQLCQRVVEKHHQTKVQQINQTIFQQSNEVHISQGSKTTLNHLKNQNDKNETNKDLIQGELKQPNPSVTVPNKKSTKKSKKQIKKIVQELMRPISEEIRLKFSQDLQKLDQEMIKLKTQEKDTGKMLKQELQKSNTLFNLIKLIAHQQSHKKKDQSQNQSQIDNNDEQSIRGKNKKNKKQNKKGKNKNKKSTEKNIFLQILQNFNSYADKSNHDFEIMEDEELDEFLKKQLGFKEIYENQNYCLEKINSEAAKIAAENMSLKWNNPIRSYESLMVMRLIKQHYWLFQGNVFPTEIVQYGDQLKQLDKKMKKLKQYREDKIANGQNDKKVKEANRQIDYLEFYYKLKKNPDRVYTFLNITSPTPKIKRVFHDILGDVDLQNTKFVQELYKQVKGKVKIIEDFPIKLKIEIIQ